MADEREILTWEAFGQASRELAQMVADDGYEPDMVLSIARGGLLIGGAMGYALSIKNTYTMNVEFYTDIDERLEVPRILPPAPDFVDLHEARSGDPAEAPHHPREAQLQVGQRVVELVAHAGGEQTHRGHALGGDHASP